MIWFKLSKNYNKKIIKVFIKLKKEMFKLHE